MFQEHGIPNKLITGNDTQFAASVFQTFSKQYGFQHVTTSPYYPQANRLIERNVQTVMNIMQKCKKSGADPHLAMLCLRTTPSSALTCRAAKFQGMSIQPTSHDETNAVYSRTRGC